MLALWLAKVVPALLLLGFELDFVASVLAALTTLPPWWTAVSRLLPSVGADMGGRGFGRSPSRFEKGGARWL